ncbi:hypothetical protein HK096_006798 [Nowakowskiella sp. JEL0078]|nr:hypothetical protein HK096_006798 [Nowakowskiella sp. JEL0078]
MDEKDKSVSVTNDDKILSLPEPENIEPPSNKTTSSQPPNVITAPDLIPSAVAFLNSPVAKTASYDQKHSFLKRKGLSDSQIVESFKLAENAIHSKSSERVLGLVSQLSSDSHQKIHSIQQKSKAVITPSPLVPNRPEFLSSNNVTKIQPKKSFWYYFIASLLGSSVTVISAVYLLKKQFYQKLVALGIAYKSLMRERAQQISKLIQKIIVFCKQYSPYDTPPTLESPQTRPITLPLTCLSSFAGTQSRLTSLENQIRALIETRNNTPLKQPLENLVDAITELKVKLSVEMYTPSEWGRADGAGPVRAEIRALKGMFLSLRNFPSVKRDEKSQKIMESDLNTGNAVVDNIPLSVEAPVEAESLIQ